MGPRERERLEKIEENKLVRQEKLVERRMCHKLHTLGCLTYKFVSPGEAGVPDRIVILPTGAVCFVELKRKGGKLSRLQLWSFSKLRSRGVPVLIIHGDEEADAFVDVVRRTVRGNPKAFPPYSPGRGGPKPNPHKPKPASPEPSALRPVDSGDSGPSVEGEGFDL